jgi:hypothetical protein
VETLDHSSPFITYYTYSCIHVMRMKNIAIKRTSPPREASLTRVVYFYKPGSSGSANNVSQGSTEIQLTWTAWLLSPLLDFCSSRAKVRLLRSQSTAPFERRFQWNAHRRLIEHIDDYPIEFNCRTIVRTVYFNL